MRKYILGLLRNAAKVSLRATKGSAAIYSSDDKKRLLRHFVPRNDTKMTFCNSPISGINVFFLILLLSGNVYAQVKQLRSQESIEMIIRADKRDYKQSEIIDIELEVKNSREKNVKIFNPDYWGVSQIVITNSNGQKIEPQEIKMERSSFSDFSDYMVIPAGGSRDHIFKNLAWFDCDGALQYTTAQLVPGTYNIYVTVTNPPKCDSKKYSATSLSGTIVSNTITLNIVK